MACCDDPTEPQKINRRDLIRAQEDYGNLVRDLFTEDPEKVILKLLDGSTGYLRELAALRAYHPSVRFRAIGLLDKNSQSVLKQIIDQEADSIFAQAAQSRLDELNTVQPGLLSKVLKTVF